MVRSLVRRRGMLALIGVILLFLVGTATAVAVGSDEPILQPGVSPPRLDEETEHTLLERDFAFESRRTAGDITLSGPEAGQLRGAAARQAAQARKAARKAPATTGPPSFGGTW